MEKLNNILEHEFYQKRIEMIMYDKAMKKLYIKLEDVKDDDDINEFISQLKRDIAYNSMQMIDESWYEVKQINKKRKIDDTEEIKTCSQPIGLCRCSNEFPIEMPKLVE